MNGAFPVDDGFRSTGRTFQILVDQYMEMLIGRFSIPVTQVTHATPPGAVAAITGT
jgi:hypothetical protein